MTGRIRPGGAVLARESSAVIGGTGFGEVGEILEPGGHGGMGVKASAHQEGQARLKQTGHCLSKYLTGGEKAKTEGHCHDRLS